MTAHREMRSSRRLWGFRIAAVLVGLSTFGLLELLCWAFDWGRSDEQPDPFVGFRQIRPLFVLDREGESGPPGQRYHIPKGRRLFFAPDSFLARKPENGFRIFCLGGSTVQGRPFSKETSFPTWLRLALEAAEPDRDWEVVNCGGVSYASYRLVPILKECLQYQPDLFIVCAGHNEFLEDRSYSDVKGKPQIVVRSHRLLSHCRSYWVYRSILLKLAGESEPEGSRHRTVLPAEVDARLDHRGGLESYHRDDQWRAAVVAHFEVNLRRMVSLACSAGTPLIFVLPPSNLSDCPPFKSEHRRGFTERQRSEWERLIEQARRRYRTDVAAAARLLRQALTLDNRYALTWYEFGQCLETLRQYDQARQAFLRARDEDVCPLRMISELDRAMRRVAAETKRPILDAHRLLEGQCPHRILGDYLLVDHVHPSFRGHQIIANALADVMAERG
ncbi:MAG: SGNH/GDSL hydrolase family protein, partial [Planctomycetes bacterium]|nr:SGNH/GDSL hydrolase family protein [Planctomycetota bacterium]